MQVLHHVKVSSMQFEGTLKSWNDDKGFGFISPSQGGQDIFVHISECRFGGRPALSEPLRFEVSLNPQGKKRAVNVQRVNAQQYAAQPERGRRPVRLSRSGGASGSGLKTVIALLLMAALGWQGYTHYQKGAKAQTEALTQGSVGIQPLLTEPARPAAARFSCDGRQHCSQMTTCAEATYFLNNCPGVKMDGDNDGIPCEEQLCR
ncbi:cold shock domain-containing protein [Polaromonas sp. P2-4]|nr:cold shock domain-containing protein [Polaromonas sp. P2-4]